MRLKRSDMVTTVYVGEPWNHTVMVVDRFNGAEFRVPLEHHKKHSPTGFGWGYGGSGPSDLARCLLIDALGLLALCSVCRGSGRVSSGRDGVLKPAEKTVANSDACPECYGDGIGSALELNYQHFKWDVIVQLPMDKEWEMPRSDVVEWWTRVVDKDERF